MKILKYTTILFVLLSLIPVVDSLTLTPAIPIDNTTTGINPVLYVEVNNITSNNTLTFYQYTSNKRVLCNYSINQSGLYLCNTSLTDQSVYWSVSAGNYSSNIYHFNIKQNYIIWYIIIILTVVLLVWAITSREIFIPLIDIAVILSTIIPLIKVFPFMLFIDIIMLVFLIATLIINW